MCNHCCITQHCKAPPNRRARNISSAKIPIEFLTAVYPSARRNFVIKAAWPQQRTLCSTPSRLAPRLIRHLALRAGSRGSAGESLARLCLWNVCQAHKGRSVKRRGVGLVQVWGAPSYSMSQPCLTCASLCLLIFISPTNTSPSFLVCHRQKRHTLAMSAFLAKFGLFPTPNLPVLQPCRQGCPFLGGGNTLTLAASWDVKVATFSWEASSSRRSFLICCLGLEERERTGSARSKCRAKTTQAANRMRWR